MKHIITALTCLSLAGFVLADDTIDEAILLEDIAEDSAEQTQTEAEFTGMPELFTEDRVDVADPSPSEQAAGAKVNVVNVSETFFQLVRDAETDTLVRQPTNEASPGDLIEIVIQATNASDEPVTDVELTNSVPKGPVTLLRDSFQTDLNNGLYRLSRNGSDFFPAEADLEAADINFLQWLIFKLEPGESEQFSYRIQINSN